MLVQNFLAKLLTDERGYNQRVCRLDRCRASPFSPAYPLIAKQLVCLVGNNVTTVPVHIMETNASLSMISRLPTSVMYALSELVSVYVTDECQPLGGLCGTLIITVVQ